MAADTLTDAQAGFLRARANGRAYRTEDDIRDGVWTYRPFWAARPETISSGTVAELRARGLDNDRHGITPAGREALARHESEARDV